MFTASEKIACRRLVQACFNFHNRNGRLISTPFEELPEPSHPIYQARSSKPLVLRTVLHRLDQDAYENPRELYTDLKLVFSTFAYCVTRSGRDWQDALRMDQHVDEMWEQKSNDNLLPPLEELFPDSSHPRLDCPPRKVNHEGSSYRSNSAINQSNKRSRSQSTASSGSADEARMPILSANHNTRSQNKRSRKSTSAAQNHHNADDDGSNGLGVKDRVNDPDSGWMRDCDSYLNSQALGTFILSRLKDERLPATNLPSHSIGHPGALSDTTIAQDSPALKLELIEDRLNQNLYNSLETFDQDLHQVFKDAEKAYSQNLDRLSGIYVLKRLYQELTHGDAMMTLRDSIPVGSAKKLSSVTMGPGNATQLPRNEEMIKLRAKDKVLLEGVRHKGDYFRIGDWVHLFNPDHPSKPIVAQIFNTYRRVDSGRRMINVCWYYRPEDTVHYVSRSFIVDEVFKTGNFLEHVVEDIMGRCLVLFYTKYLRGRPMAPLWTPGMPTYICEHRYKDDNYTFKKIKNWESCIPSNTRNESSDENFRPFATMQSASSLVRVASPFLTPTYAQVKGNGEPLIAPPEQVAKELPKDQMKCHDSHMTLARIEAKLGRLPTKPPRKPHGTNENGDTPIRHLSPPLPSQMAALQPIPPPSLPPPPASNPTHMLSLLTNYNHSYFANPPLRKFNPRCDKFSVNRKLCLIDLLAALDQFESLPAEVLETLGASTKDGCNEEENSGVQEDLRVPGGEESSTRASGASGGELVWFPCLPSSSGRANTSEDPPSRKNKHKQRAPDGARSSASSSLTHSQAYLDWLQSSQSHA